MPNSPAGPGPVAAPQPEGQRQGAALREAGHDGLRPVEAVLGAGGVEQVVEEIDGGDELRAAPGDAVGARTSANPDMNGCGARGNTVRNRPSGSRWGTSGSRSCSSAPLPWMSSSSRSGSWRPRTTLVTNGAATEGTLSAAQ